LFITFIIYGRYEIANPHGVWKSREKFGEKGEKLLKALRKRTLPSDFQFTHIPDPSKERDYEWDIRFNTLIAKDNANWVEALAELETPFDWYSGHSPSYGVVESTRPGEWALMPMARPYRPWHDPCKGVIQFRNYESCRKHFEHGCYMPWGECRTFDSIKLFMHPEVGGTCTTCPNPHLWEFKKQLVALIAKTNSWPFEKDIAKLRTDFHLDMRDTYRLEMVLGVWRTENNAELWDPWRPRRGFAWAQVIIGDDHYYPFY
jgi:hypothetical protein